MELSIGTIELIIGAISAITILFKSVAFVKEGELGSKTTFGKAIRTRNKKIKILKPGFTLLLPFINSTKRAHIRMDSVTLNDLTVTFNNGLSYQYSAFVAYHVSSEPDDLERYLYQVENPKELISQKLSTEIRELLTKENDARKATAEEINKNLAEALKDYLLSKIGVILDSCGITSLTESAQAQSVNVTEAKLKIAEKIYTTRVSIPESVLAACFGAMPITPNEKITVNVTSNKGSKKDEKGRVINIETSENKEDEED